MKRKPVRLRAGFSVIESLAAVALLAIALAPLYSMLQQIATATVRIETFVEAREIAGTVTSLLDAGLDVPAEIQGWSVNVTSAPSTSPERVDGYLGGQYFTLTVESYVVTLRRGAHVFERPFSKIDLAPIYENEEEAIFSNM